MLPTDEHDTNLAVLIDKLKTFCDEHSLPHESADQLLHTLYEEEPRRESLCQWLRDFIDQWNACESRSCQGGQNRRSLKVYDNYEISPCKRYDEPDSPGKFYFEVCDPEEADVWTLYGHINGEGVQAIGDFTNREHAEEVFFRITGLTFTGSYNAGAHLRIMHAGPKLLEALRTASEWIDAQHFVQRTLIQETIRQAIAEATGRAA